MTSRTLRDVLELFLPVVRRYDDVPVDKTPREVRKFDEAMLNTWGVDIDNIDWADIDARPENEWHDDWYEHYEKVKWELQNSSIAVSHGAARAFYEACRPSLFALYSAGWQNGYTVNGIRPGRVA